MKPQPSPSLPLEIELKLCLVDPDPASLARRLARTPVLARRKASSQTLHNIYFDTPDQALRRQRVALRLRRTGDEVQGKWLQTLKTSGADESALSRRGEWESPVPDQALAPAALEASPWSDIDPDGQLMASLSPCFMTVFERTTWLVRRRDGSAVEVALDLGYIDANDKRAPICELELELKAGQPVALFDIARDISNHIAVLPASLSKAQRGYLLAQGELEQPRHAQVPQLSSKVTWQELAQRTLRDMFTQFTANLIALRTSDDPELVHQARIGWRRFRTGLWLFKKILAMALPPSRLPLQPLLNCLSELRNLDVALTETLPPLASAYAQGDDRRTSSWQAMVLALTQAAAVQRQTVQLALEQPAVGTCLLAISEWLENLSTGGDAGVEPRGLLRHWAKCRMVRLQKKLERAQTQACTPEQLHHVRILAKRLRYGAEALHDLLPAQLARHCQQQAADLQSSIGVNRDMAQAMALVTRLNLDRKIMAFLQRVAGS